MEMSAKSLAQYRTDMRLARTVRHECADCQDLTDHGDPAGPCARHSGHCIGCGSEAVEERDEHQYADGVPAYWCRKCLDRQPDTDGLVIDDMGGAR
jgi:hypothetical protein